jgi:hypothetical protein
MVYFSWSVCSYSNGANSIVGFPSLNISTTNNEACLIAPEVIDLSAILDYSQW